MYDAVELNSFPCDWGPYCYFEVMIPGRLDYCFQDGDVLPLITAGWMIDSFAAREKILRCLPHIPLLDISDAATSIPLMLYPWHDWRHVIVGQMADYTNPHYSSWWGWNLDHMNLVFHFLLLSCVWNEFSYYLSRYNPLFQTSVPLKIPFFLAVPTYLSHFLFFPRS